MGSKAAALHELAVAGLPVPSAYAIPYYRAKAIAAEASLASCSEIEKLGYPLAVRSSANIEDTVGGAAPGLFESVLNVSNLSELHAAIDTVLESARTPLVCAYLKLRSIEDAPRVSVIVQRQVMATLGEGVIYTRLPGNPDSAKAMIEMPGQRPIWIRRETSQIDSGDARLSDEEVTTLWSLALKAEEALGHSQGLDIEWVWDAQGPQLVQARPIVHRALPSRQTPEIQSLIDFSREEPQKLWRLDATHNPMPLSPAQSGLVSLADGLAPYDMRVVGGYLYTSAPPDTASAPKLKAQELQDFFENKILPRMEEALAPVEGPTAPSLQQALAAYRTVFQCYTSELSPTLAASGSSGGGNPLSHWLNRARLGELSFEELMDAVAPISPAWDVAVPTYAETPELVSKALGASPAHPPSSQGVSLREADDLLFYRAQSAVRRSLLALAHSWKIGEEIFFMPLQSVQANSHRVQVPPNLLDAACKAREQLDKNQAREMPLAFCNGQAIPTRIPPEGNVWRGIGSGGHANGEVLRVVELQQFPTLNPELATVLVMPTVTPAHALAAIGAVAVVCEYGDHLGHGAAMARELGIPCVVGCTRAWRELQTGDRVAVHGQAGLVARL